MARINAVIAVKFICFLFLTVPAVAQSDSSQINFTKRKSLVIAGSAATYTATMIGLNEVWYKDYPRESFHFFNDAAEWKQVDKVGHFFSAFHLSNISTQTLRWAGLKEKKAAFVGSVASLAMVSSVEIFDGYSSAYGASAHDIIANAAGSVFYLGQHVAWNETRIRPKFSFHTTSFAGQRPNVLGKTPVQQFLKDYNGQTYWLSFDVDKFIPFPKWLNIAAGYGAEEMIYARDESNIAAGFHPYRQYYVALDFDLSSIKTKSKFLNALIHLADMIKLPAPTLDFSKKGVKAHALYF